MYLNCMNFNNMVGYIKYNYKNKTKNKSSHKPQSVKYKDIT